MVKTLYSKNFIKNFFYRLDKDLFFSYRNWVTTENNKMPFTLAGPQVLRLLRDPLAAYTSITVYICHHFLLYEITIPSFIKLKDREYKHVSIFTCHVNTNSFDNQTHLNYLKIGLVWYSDACLMLNNSYSKIYKNIFFSESCRPLPLKLWT